MGIAFPWRLLEDYPLSSDDRTSLEKISGKAENVERHRHLLREGESANVGYLLIEGWAIRYRMLTDGKRRIIGFLLPGDMCNVHIFDLARMDHGVEMLSPGKVIRVSQDAIKAIVDERPEVGRALWRRTLTDEAVLREWLVNIGGRDAYTRVAHLLCELYTRMERARQVDNDSFHLPSNQTHLAEALGLTSIHINRMLRRLRLEGLITYRGQRLTVHDIGGLKIAGGFDAGYLFAGSLSPAIAVT